MFTMPQSPGVVMQGGYDRVDPYHTLGALPVSGGGQQQAPAIAALQPTALERGEKPWHPDSPLFWFGTILAVTLGLIGASTSIRVGPFRAAVGAGKVLNNRPPPLRSDHP